MDEVFDPGPVVNLADPNYPSGRVVVLRVATVDWPVNPSMTKAYVEQILFGSTSGQKSIRGYFEANSWGQFQVSKGAVPGWVNLDAALAGYLLAGGIEGGAQFLTDILVNAGVDWGALDADRDDTIDVDEAQLVLLIPNGPVPGAYSQFASVRRVEPGIAGIVPTPAGLFRFPLRPVVTFSVKPGSDPDRATNPIRSLPALAHELAHAFFRLPDRYGNNSGYLSGTGAFDMMASSNTWVHLPMPDKVAIGWITPKVVRAQLGECLAFGASEAEPDALILVPADAFAADPLEFWVVEHRAKTFDPGGYDDGLPSDGLAVWYVSSGQHPADAGHDELRLVDASSPDQDPDLYANPAAGALFQPAGAKRWLFGRTGDVVFLTFSRVSKPFLEESGPVMLAEF